MNSLAKSACAAGGLALVCALPAAVAYSIRAPSSQVFAPSVYRGSRRRRVIALTFDDGPSEGTAAILDYLKKEGVRGTFFQCGINVRRHPETSPRLQADGHEIGNHTFSHRRLCPRLGFNMNRISPVDLYKELAETQGIIAATTGVVPRWFRAPYGMRWFGLRSAQRRLNLTGAYWTVIGHDWEWDAGRVADHVIRGVSPGGIVCLHDGRESREKPDISVTIDAVKLIVARLKSMGYGFETVSEIVRP